MDASPLITVTLNPAIDKTLFVNDFEIGAVNRVKSSVRQAGGKGLNVATMLALAGNSVVVTGFLGRENDAIFRSHFKQYGLDNQFVPVAGETREGTKIVDSSRSVTTDLNLPGFSPSVAEQQALLDKMKELPNAGCWIVFSGSLPSGVSTEFFSELLAVAKKQGANVAVDSSGPALKTAIKAGVHLAKPNIHEFQELLEQPLIGRQTIIEASKKLLLNHPESKTLIVSCGEEGAIFIDRNQPALVSKAPKVDVVSTVGAGDALLAGYLHAVNKREHSKNCARYATVFAECRLRSLTPDLPTNDSIQQKLDQVQLLDGEER